jgi:putative oxidoreductase
MNMSINYIISVLALMLSIVSCVQKSSVKTVVVRLNVAGQKNIQEVGVRGQGKPLSWQQDMELTPIVKDSLYHATFSVLTGYKFVEAKFTINGQFELQDADNRKIEFGAGDTTLYEATFGVAK